MFGLEPDLRQCFVHVISEDSGETARLRLRSLARSFAAHLCEKYKNLIGRSDRLFASSVFILIVGMTELRRGSL